MALSAPIMAGGDDRISNLPDCLLSVILSFLPVKDSARSSVLSTRWRHLWSTSPINLDISSLSPDDDDNSWPATVARVLSVHSGPIRTCRLTRPHRTPETIDALIDTITRRRIQELVLVPNLSPSAARRLLACDSLRVLFLARCYYPEPPPQLPCSSSLRKITLFKVHVSGPAVTGLISACSAIDTFELLSCKCLGRVHVHSPSLRILWAAEMPKLPYVEQAEFEELKVEDAPKLARLMFDEKFTRSVIVNVCNTPNLQFLGFVHMAMKSVSLSHTEFKHESDTSFSSAMQSLRTLAIRVNLSNYHQMRRVADMLRFFPRLDTLNIMIEFVPRASDRERYQEPEGSFNCLDFHLKNVRVKGYSGRDNHVAFVKFLISRARVLKVMTLFSPLHIWSEEWVEAQRHQLSLSTMASVDAQVSFERDNSLWNTDL